MIVDADISQCFDSISHDSILRRLTHFPAKSIINKWLTCGIVIDSVWLGMEEGTPQGSVLWPLLCNMALHGLEEALPVNSTCQGFVKSKGRLLITYADDMVTFVIIV